MKKQIESIEYGEELVVIARYKNEWTYFVSEKDLWILDKKSRAYSFHKAGYELPLDDYSDRFDIPLLDENTAETFFPEMQEFEVSSEMLRKMILEKDANNTLEDEAQYFPALYVDFDDKELISYFPEPFPFEKYIPPEWTSSYAEFFDKVPSALQYWKIGERNFLDAIS